MPVDTTSALDAFDSVSAAALKDTGCFVEEMPYSPNRTGNTTTSPVSPSSDTEKAAELDVRAQRAALLAARSIDENDADFQRYFEACEAKGFFEGCDPQHDTQEWLERLKKVISVYQRSPDEREAERLKTKALHYVRTNEFSRAVECYNEAISLIPSGPKTHTYLANRAALMCRSGDFEAAIRDCTAAIALNPQYAKVHSRLGYIYSCMSRFEEAVAACEIAVQLDPYDSSHMKLLEDAACKLEERMQSDAITHAAAQKAAYEAQLAAAAEESYKQHCLRQSAAAAAMRESDEDAAVKLSKAAKMLGADPASLQSQLAAERAACAQLDESFKREQEQREANMRKFAKVMKLLGDKEAEGLLVHGGGSGDYYLEQRGLDESGSGSRRNSLTTVMKGLQEMKRGISGRVTRSMSNSPPVRRGSRHLKSTGSSSKLTGTLQGVFSRSDSASTADMQNFVNTAGNDSSDEEDNNNSSSNNSSSGSSSNSKKQFSSSGRGRQRGSGAAAATGGSSTGWQLASPESTTSNSAILSSAGSSCIRIGDVSTPLRAERSIADMAAEALQAVRDEDEAAVFADKTDTSTDVAASAASGSSSSGEVTAIAAAAPTRQRHVRTSGARQHRVVEDLFGDMMLQQHSTSPKHKRHFTHNSTSSSSSSVATVTAAEECYAPRSSSGATVSGGSSSTSSVTSTGNGAPPRMPAVPRRSSKSTSPGLSPMSPLVTGSSGIPSASGIASGHRSRSNSTTAAAAAAAIAAAAGAAAAAAAAAELDAQQLRSVAVAALESVELDAAPLATAVVTECSSSSSSSSSSSVDVQEEIVGMRQGDSPEVATEATDATAAAVTSDEGNSGAADAVIVSVD
jgi:tetratricopeptide (TPR) repeat protein